MQCLAVTCTRKKQGPCSDVAVLLVDFTSVECDVSLSRFPAEPSKDHVRVPT